MTIVFTALPRWCWRLFAREFVKRPQGATSGAETALNGPGGVLRAVGERDCFRNLRRGFGHVDDVHLSTSCCVLR